MACCLWNWVQTKYKKKLLCTLKEACVKVKHTQIFNKLFKNVLNYQLNRSDVFCLVLMVHTKRVCSASEYEAYDVGNTYFFISAGNEKCMYV
jgi:hypothetical protein